MTEPGTSRGTSDHAESRSASPSRRRSEDLKEKILGLEEENEMLWNQLAEQERQLSDEATNDADPAPEAVAASVTEEIIQDADPVPVLPVRRRTHRRRHTFVQPSDTPAAAIDFAREQWTPEALEGGVAALERASRLADRLNVRHSLRWLQRPCSVHFAPEPEIYAPPADEVSQVHLFR